VCGQKVGQKYITRFKQKSKEGSLNVPCNGLFGRFVYIVMDKNKELNLCEVNVDGKYVVDGVGTAHKVTNCATCKKSKTCNKCGIDWCTEHKDKKGRVTIPYKTLSEADFKEAAYYVKGADFKFKNDQCWDSGRAGGEKAQYPGQGRLMVDTQATRVMDTKKNVYIVQEPAAF
jgi:hypothetical protein